MDSPSPPVCGRVYGATLAQSFAFCNGVLAGFFLDGGLVVACVVLQRRVWLGLRRCPTCTALGRFPEQGDTLYPRRGLRPLHPLGRGGFCLGTYIECYPAALAGGLGWLLLRL